LNRKATRYSETLLRLVSVAFISRSKQFLLD